MQLEMIMIVPGVIFLSQCIFYTTFGVFNRFIRIHIFPIGQTGVLPLSLCLIAGQFLALLIAWQIASQPVSQTQRERERERDSDAGRERDGEKWRQGAAFSELSCRDKCCCCRLAQGNPLIAVVAVSAIDRWCTGDFRAHRLTCHCTRHRQWNVTN